MYNIFNAILNIYDNDGSKFRMHTLNYIEKL